MLTLIVRIDEPDSDLSGYPITLREFDPAEGKSGNISVADKIPCPLPLMDGTTDSTDDWIANVLARGDHSVLTGHSHDIDRLTEIGTYLHGLLMQTDVGRQWATHCQECGPTGNGTPRLRTYLDIQPDNLQHLPWELMIDQHDSHATFMVEDYPVMRGSPETLQVTGDPDISLPVRVMVVICDNDVQYQAEDEVDAIYAGLAHQPGIWQVDVLREPGSDLLHRRLQIFQPHILHLIAHTESLNPLAFRVRNTNPANMDDDDPWYLKADQLANPLTRDSLPPVLIMNACHTQAVVPTERFRRLAARGVIATQAAINSEEAVYFTKNFYRHLADTGSLEKSMLRTRNSMSHEWKIPSLAWAMPVLTVYGSPDTVIRPDLSALGKNAHALLESDRYPLMDLLVDRTENHRMICGNGHKQPDKHLVLISGRSQSGKTQLIRSCMMTWELRGSRSILADLESHSGDNSTLTTSDTLASICGTLYQAITETPGLPGVNVAWLSRINKLREALAKIGRVTPDEESGPYDEVCREMLIILAGVAGGQPFLLGLDHLEKIMKNDLEGPICTKILKPISRGDVPDVHAIAAVAKENPRDYRLGWGKDDADWTRYVHEVEVDFFEPHQVMRLGREYGARKGWVAKTDWQHVLVMAKKLHQAAWSPAQLPILAGFYSDFFQANGESL